jgi:hypothetical protein
MRDHRGIQALAIGTCALSVAIASWATGWIAVTPRPDRTLHLRIGEALAQEALAHVGSGGRVVVFARDTAEFEQPAADLALRSFTAEMQKAGHPVTDLRLVAEDPLRPIHLPENDLFEVLRKSKQGDIVVSMMGPVLLAQDQRLALGTPKASVIAFCPGSSAEVLDPAQLISMGLLHGGVLAASSTGTPQQPAPIPATFETLYRRMGPMTPIRQSRSKDRP